MFSVSGIGAIVVIVLVGCFVLGIIFGFIED